MLSKLAVQPQVHPQQMEIGQPDWADPEWAFNKPIPEEKLPHGDPHACFGWIDGKLFIGKRHHMGIMYMLIEDFGYTFEQLQTAQQAWGWVYTEHKEFVKWDLDWSKVEDQWLDVEGNPVTKKRYGIRFTSDAATTQDEEAMDRAQVALENYYKVKFIRHKDMWTAEEFAPNFENAYGEEGYYRYYNENEDIRTDKSFKQIPAKTASNNFSWMVDEDGRFYADFENGHPGMALGLLGFTFDDVQRMAEETGKDNWQVLDELTAPLQAKALQWGFVWDHVINIGSGAFGAPNLDPQTLQEVMNTVKENVRRIDPEAKFNTEQFDWTNPWWTGEFGLPETMAKEARYTKAVAFIDGKLYTGVNHLEIADRVREENPIATTTLNQLWGWIVWRGEAGRQYSMVEWYSDWMEGMQNYALADDALKAVQKEFPLVEGSEFGPPPDVRAEMAKY